MKWLIILLTVAAGSCGDILCAKGMSIEGELDYSGLSAVGRAFRFTVTRRLVILGIFFDAVGFFSLLALLSVSQLSIAIPATALGFVLDTVGARFLLHENVHWRRWVGVMLVAVGVLLAVRTGPHKPLTRTGTPGTATVQADQHQSGYDQAGSSGLDHKSPSAKVLAKP